MSQVPTFRVRYALGVALPLCVIGPVLVVLGVLIRNPMSMVLGVMNTGLGLGFLSVPFIVIRGQELALCNMLGMTMRRAIVADDLGGPVGFSIQNEGRLLRWDDPARKARPIRISRIISRNEDFDALAAWLRTGRLS